MKRPTASSRPARLFVATVPPDEVRDLIASIERPAIPGVRYTTRDQWHVTLAFIGTARPAEVSAALDRVQVGPATASLRPGLMRLGGGAAALSVTGLDGWARGVGDALAEAGYAIERRPFVGHLTIARLKPGASLAREPMLPEATWTASSFSLFASELGRGPARYTALASFPARTGAAG